jgi:hypothetical protein
MNSIMALQQNSRIKMALAHSSQASPLRVATNGDAKMEAQSTSPPLARLLLESVAASGGNRRPDVDRSGHAIRH